MEKFDIESIFEGMSKEDLPTNRPVSPEPPKHTIIAGGSCENEFRVPFEYSEDIVGIEVVYKQLCRLELIKTPVKIISDGTGFIIRVVFTPEESAQFGGTLLSTVAQVKIDIGGELLYSNIIRIKVLPTLKVELK